MQHEFYFQLPHKTGFFTEAGSDLLAEFADAPLNSVLFLTDPGIVKAGIASKVLDKLIAKGFKPTVFYDIPRNPNMLDGIKALAAGVVR